MGEGDDDDEEEEKNCLKEVQLERWYDRKTDLYCINSFFVVIILYLAFLLCVCMVFRVCASRYRDIC